MLSKKLIVSTLLVVITCGFASAPLFKSAMSVCDLIRDAPVLEGQIVSVHGILQNSGSGTGQPYYDELMADNCVGNGGKEIQIQIVSPDAHFLANPPRGFKPDMNSIRRVEDLLEKMEKEGRTVKQISCTVQGAFYAPKPQSSSALGGSDQYHHKLYQGYIVIQALRDVTVR
jgi:hypothetical protein